MKQVLIIHGGSNYSNDRDYHNYLSTRTIDYRRLLHTSGWKDWLATQLTNVDVLTPLFPSADNAKYQDWELYFDKIRPFLNKNTIIIGHSLGGIFLAKYLSQKEIEAAHFILLAAPFRDESTESLDSFALAQDLSKLKKYADRISLFHSKDDLVVPYTEVEKYHDLLPDATIYTFEDRGHFNTPTFPELLDLINKKLPS